MSGLDFYQVNFVCCLVKLVLALVLVQINDFIVQRLDIEADGNQRYFLIMRRLVIFLRVSLFEWTLTGIDPGIFWVVFQERESLLLIFNFTI